MSLILSGTDGLSDIDGSAATPAIRGTDANTGIFFPAADQVAISTGGTQRAVVDGSGNVGIGTSSPSGRLNLAVGASTSCTMRFTSNNTGAGAGDRGRLDFYSADNSGVAYQLGYMDYDRADGTGTASYIAFANRVAGTVAERMRINSSGVVQVGNNTGTGEVFAQNTLKVWGVIIGATGALYNSFGISSSSRISTGIYAISFTRTFANGRFGSAGSQYGAGIVFINTESTTGCRVNTVNIAGSTVDADVAFLIAGGS